MNLYLSVLLCAIDIFSACITYKKKKKKKAHKHTYISRRVTHLPT